MRPAEQQRENEAKSFDYDREHLLLLFRISASLAPVFAFTMYAYIADRLGIIDWGSGILVKLVPGATAIWLYQLVGDLVFWFGRREAIVIDDSGITIRKHFRTKHHRWSQVAHAEITQKFASAMNGNYHLTLKSPSGKKVRHIRLFGLTGSADEISAAIAQYTTVIRNSIEESGPNS